MSTQSTEKLIEGNWDQLKGKIKKQWGKLTDNDMDEMEGSYDELVGKIKETYGCTQEDIEKQLNTIINGFDFNKIKDVVQNSVENIKEKSEDVTAYVQENPMKSVLIAMAIGILAAKFLRNSSK